MADTCDLTIRCNGVKCRAPLTDRAVVTTCSHIFCLPCSESLGLATANGATRTCPACGIGLANPDDAVIAQLNPSEDYKTSVLSGLSPQVIVECAARGLSFYHYQTSQEIRFQDHRFKALMEKYNHLNNKLDNTIHEAETELGALKERLQAEHGERQDVERKNEDLAAAYRDKSRNYSKLHRLYTTLKQQQFAGGIELAAEHDAENLVQATQQQGMDRVGGMHLTNRAASHGGMGSGGTSRRMGQPWQPHHADPRTAMQSAHSAPILATPLTHRTYLPPPQQGPGMSRGVDYRGTSLRTPLQNLSPNVYGQAPMGKVGYGDLGPGMKGGRRHAGSPLQHMAGLGGGRSPRPGGFVGR